AMNKKYGLVATAWMLGSGLLWHPGTTVEAQVISEPRIGSAPRVSDASEKKTPGLLPSFLRTPSRPPKGTIVRPLLTADPSPSADQRWRSQHSQQIKSLQQPAGSSSSASPSGAAAASHRPPSTERRAVCAATSDSRTESGQQSGTSATGARRSVRELTRSLGW